MESDWQISGWKIIKNDDVTGEPGLFYVIGDENWQVELQAKN